MDNFMMVFNHSSISKYLDSQYIIEKPSISDMSSSIKDYHITYHDNRKLSNIRSYNPRRSLDMYSYSKKNSFNNINIESGYFNRLSKISEETEI